MLSKAASLSQSPKLSYVLRTQCKCAWPLGYLDISQSASSWHHGNQPISWLLTSGPSANQQVSGKWCDISLIQIVQITWHQTLVTLGASKTSDKHLKTTGSVCYSLVHKDTAWRSLFTINITQERRKKTLPCHLSRAYYITCISTIHLISMSHTWIYHLDQYGDESGPTGNCSACSQ